MQGLDFGSGPVIGTTDPVTSDIKVRMTLANIEFDLLKRIDMDWGIGVGLGQDRVQVWPAGSQHL